MIVSIKGLDPVLKLVALTHHTPPPTICNAQEIQKLDIQTHCLVELASRITYLHARHLICGHLQIFSNIDFFQKIILGTLPECQKPLDPDQDLRSVADDKSSH